MSHNDNARKETRLVIRHRGQDLMEIAHMVCLAYGLYMNSEAWN